MDSNKNEKESNYSEPDLSRFEYENMPESGFKEIEDRLETIEVKLNDIESKMLTEGKVFWWIIGIGAFALWGDKIWGFIKAIFVFLTGLFHSGIQGIFTPTDPLQLIISMVLAGLTIIIVIFGLIFWIARLIIK